MMNKPVPPSELAASVRADADKPAASQESFAARLAKATTANEMTNLIGLAPIKGRAGPKIAY